MRRYPAPGEDYLFASVSAQQFNAPLEETRLKKDAVPQT
jgi:hypothetical protein